MSATDFLLEHRRKTLAAPPSSDGWHGTTTRIGGIRRTNKVTGQRSIVWSDGKPDVPRTEADRRWLSGNDKPMRVGLCRFERPTVLA